MAKVYVDLILSGQRTIDQVPSRLRDEVLRILTEMGYGDVAEVISPAD